MLSISALLALIAFILAAVMLAQGPRSLLTWAVLLLALAVLVSWSVVLLR